jgi:hypothetical protein
VGIMPATGNEQVGGKFEAAASKKTNMIAIE